MLVSVVIISLNEVDNIKATIKSARLAAQFPSGHSVPIEIIVSDGGSTDGTIEIAKNLVDKLIVGPKGRYLQLNAGAQEAKGDILLFLHADTLLPEGGILRILYRLKNSVAVGGGFEKSWNWNTKVKLSSFLKFSALFWRGLGNWLVRMLKTFPGDNAVFTYTEFFKEMHGFLPLWICEDFDFIRRLKRKFGKKKYYIYAQLSIHQLDATRDADFFVQTIFGSGFIRCGV